MTWASQIALSDHDRRGAGEPFQGVSGSGTIDFGTIAALSIRLGGPDELALVADFGIRDAAVVSHEVFRQPEVFFGECRCQPDHRAPNALLGGVATGYSLALHLRLSLDFAKNNSRGTPPERAKRL